MITTMTKPKEKENFQMVFMINDIVQNTLLEQELNVFVRSAIIHNLRTLSIKGCSVMLVSQVFISPKLQKIEELGVGVVSN
jgi:hypothetical protein